MSPRVKAFSWHLGCSALIAFFVTVIVFFIWYPVPLYQAVGVANIVLLILLVDVVFGPLMTLLVYKVGKRTLLLDMGVIILLQLSALAYGLWTVAQGRPAWLVFNVDRFDVVQVVDIDARRQAEALPQYQAPAWLGPRWVAAVRPVDGERRNEVLFESVLGGSDIAQRPELYRPLSDSAALIKSRAQSLDRLAAFNDGAAVAAVLAAWPQATGWLPLMARVKPMVVVLGAENTEVLAIVPLQPWQP